MPVGDCFKLVRPALALCACRRVNLLVHLFQSPSTAPLDQRVESSLDLKTATSLYGCGIWAWHLLVSH